jgi:hypothetical protein
VDLGARLRAALELETHRLRPEGLCLSTRSEESELELVSRADDLANDPGCFLDIFTSYIPVRDQTNSR